jgi:hypothetical protein
LWSGLVRRIFTVSDRHKSSGRVVGAEIDVAEAPRRVDSRSCRNTLSDLG